MTSQDPLLDAAQTGIAAVLSGLAAVSVLGIPAGGLVAALVASALNNTAEQADPGRSVPRRLALVLFDALVGGWLAVALIKLPAFRGYGVEEIGVTVAAALVTLSVPWVRTHAADAASEIKGIVLEWLRRRFGGHK